MISRHSWGPAYFDSGRGPPYRYFDAGMFGMICFSAERCVCTGEDEFDAGQPRRKTANDWKACAFRGC